MHDKLQTLGAIIAASGFFYGEYMAITAFFEVELCTGIDSCSWLFASWHPALWLVLFIVIYLPLSPLVSVFYGWPFYLVAAVVVWVANKRQRKSNV